MRLLVMTTLIGLVAGGPGHAGKGPLRQATSAPADALSRMQPLLDTAELMESHATGRATRRW